MPSQYQVLVPGMLTSNTENLNRTLVPLKSCYVTFYMYETHWQKARQHKLKRHASFWPPSLPTECKCFVILHSLIHAFPLEKKSKCPSGDDKKFTQKWVLVSISFLGIRAIGGTLLTTTEKRRLKKTLSISTTKWQILTNPRDHVTSAPSAPYDQPRTTPRLWQQTGRPTDWEDPTRDKHI